MADHIKNMLGEAIESEIGALSSLDYGAEERSKVIDNIATLYKLRIEETKNEMDFEEKRDKRIMEDLQKNQECLLKEHQLDRDARNQERDAQIRINLISEQVKDRYFKTGIEVVGIVLPLMFYAVWMKKGFKFEETGTFCSSTFRGLISNFKPKRK